jgi:hypothetical protein
VSFAQGNSNLQYFEDSRSCQGRELGEDRFDEQHTAPWQWGIVGVKSYRRVSENRTYKKENPGTNFWTQNPGPKLEI